VANLSGTLASRLAEGAGLVRAKTGTLNGASALAGTIVTQDGAWLGFAIILNGIPNNATPALGAMDEFVASLASCGCG
jgi:D-alanyl-D-alanine carboxypeptidase/D-alanyl-D-alanine-endopeptidase (penicillin-binding protein 4)